MSKFFGRLLDAVLFIAVVSMSTILAFATVMGFSTGDFSQGLMYYFN